MRINFLIILLVFTVAGCTNNNSEKTSDGTPGASGKQTANEKAESNGYWERLVMTEFRDNRGVISAIMPFPASWKIMKAGGNGEPSITGPNGITVTDFPVRSFIYNYDRGLQQVYMQSGQQMRSLPGIEQLIQEDFIPWGNSRGLQFVKHYEIPEITKMDKWYTEQLYKAMPSRSDIAAIGTEWRSSDGKPYFLLIHLNASTSETMQNWYYMAAGLEAETSYFEAAKKQYIFALANTRYNLEPIMAYNEQEAQRVGQSWAQHNQRMAQNQANFEASQRAFVNKSNAINDAIMSGWRERNAAGDIQQEKIIDGIYERTNVENTETGNQYKVTAGANQYWMNNNGEYISTELQDYNPNLDKNMNEQKWQELKKIKD